MLSVSLDGVSNALDIFRPHPMLKLILDSCQKHIGVRASLYGGVCWGGGRGGGVAPVAYTYDVAGGRP